MPEMAREDREFVEQKLELSRVEFDRILTTQPRTWREYPNNSWIFLMHDNPAMLRIARTARSLGLLPSGFGDNMLARDPEQANKTDIR